MVLLRQLLKPTVCLFVYFFLNLLSNAYTLARPSGRKTRRGGKVKDTTSIDNDSVVPTFIDSNRRHLQ